VKGPPPLSKARQLAIRQEIIRAYARPFPGSGQPMLCKAGNGEFQYRMKNKMPMLRDKVIFDDLAKARACAERLTLALGLPIARAYVCQRSRRGHAHLTTDLMGKKGRK
jgi:hypothetical protein